MHLLSSIKFELRYFSCQIISLTGNFYIYALFYKISSVFSDAVIKNECLHVHIAFCPNTLLFSLALIALFSKSKLFYLGSSSDLLLLQRKINIHLWRRPLRLLRSRNKCEIFLRKSIRLRQSSTIAASVHLWLFISFFHFHCHFQSFNFSFKYDAFQIQLQT